MSGGFRLRDPQAFVDMADADLPGQQQAENSQARSVAESLKQAFECRELGFQIYALTNISWTAYSAYTQMHILKGVIRD